MLFVYKPTAYIQYSIYNIPFRVQVHKQFELLTQLCGISFSAGLKSANPTGQYDSVSIKD